MEHAQNLITKIKHIGIWSFIRYKNIFWVCSYLIAIIAANLSITFWGPQAVIWNSLILIAFDLTARDGLHEAWKGRLLWPKMFLLIASGSLLSWWLYADTVRIALASFIAFGLAGLSDTVIYFLLDEKSRMVKMNGSNVASSIVDTVAFVVFANLPLWIIPGQVAVKIVGGAVWSVLLSRPFNNTNINMKVLL